MGSIYDWAISIADQLEFVHVIYLLLSSAAMLIGTVALLWGSMIDAPSAESFHTVGLKRRFLFREIRQRVDWFSQGTKIIHDAYHQFPNHVVKLPSLDRVSIMLPLRYLDEIKDLPHDISCSDQATSDFWVGSWTTVDYSMFGRAGLDAVRMQFVNKFAKQIGPAVDEATNAINQNFDRYHDWTAIEAHPKILLTVGQTMARIIVGKELSRNSDWVENIIGYAHNVFLAAVYLKLLPKFMRPLMAILSPYIYRIHLCRRRIRHIISKVITERISLRQKDPDVWAAKMQDENDRTTIDWLIEASPPEEATIALIAHRLTGIGFGSIHTTSNQISNSLLFLAADFDSWGPPLLEEICSVLGPRPDWSTLSSAQLSKLWKLDSFLKESQRFHPPSQLSVNRKLLQPLRLSSGELLPRNAHICFPGVPISMSEHYFEDAKTFDGFRFERMRRDPTIKESGTQFTSTYAGSLHFGHGRNACPGRFVAGMISKLILIKLLLRYEFRIPDGGSRPKNLMFMDMDLPNPQYIIMCRDRNQ